MSTFTEIVAEFPNLYKSSWTWPVPVPVAGTAPSLHLLSWPRSRPLISDALKLLCKHGIIPNMNEPWKHSFENMLWIYLNDIVSYLQ